MIDVGLLDALKNIGSLFGPSVLLRPQQAYADNTTPTTTTATTTTAYRDYPSMYYETNGSNAASGNASQGSNWQEPPSEPRTFDDIYSNEDNTKTNLGGLQDSADDSNGDWDIGYRPLPTEEDSGSSGSPGARLPREDSLNEITGFGPRPNSAHDNAKRQFDEEMAQVSLIEDPIERENAERQAAERAAEYQMLSPYLSRNDDGSWNWEQYGIDSDDLAGQEATRFMLMHPDSANGMTSWGELAVAGDGYDNLWKTALVDWDALDPYTQNIETNWRYVDDNGNFSIDKFLADPGLDIRDAGQMSDDDLLLLYGTSGSQIDAMNDALAYDWNIPMYLSNDVDQYQLADAFQDEDFGNYVINYYGNEDNLHPYIRGFDQDANKLNLNDQAIARVAQASSNLGHELPFSYGELERIPYLGADALNRGQSNDIANLMDMPEGYQPFNNDILTVYSAYDSRGYPRGDYVTPILQQHGYSSWPERS